MWEIIRAGGGFMWPIILCSIAAVAIILERLWTLQSSRVIPRDLAQKVWNWIEADQLRQARGRARAELAPREAPGHWTRQS
jgi:biopolymer transport protein ExbB